MAYTGKGKLAAVAGLCALFVTVLIFFQVFPEQDGLRWFGLLFIVLGETLPVAGFIWCENHLPPSLPPGARGGLYSIALLYGAAAILVALGFLFFPGGVRWLITWEIALLLGSGIMAAVALRRAAVGAGGADRAPALAAAANMRRLEEEVLALSKEPDYQRFLPRLRRIFEEIKYSDYAGVSGADEALTERVTGLRNLLAGDEPDKEAALGRRADEISRLLREREREVRLAKASVNTRIP